MTFERSTPATIGPVQMTPLSLDERLECPACGGRGTRKGPAFRRGQIRNRCHLCTGTGSVNRSKIQSLCDQMQRVANAMQAGDDESAAKAARIAGRIAARLLV